MIELSYKGNKKGLMNYIGSQICEDCLGEGVVYQTVRIHAANLAPEGDYEFEPRTCHCRMMESDRTEE